VLIIEQEKETNQIGRQPQNILKCKTIKCLILKT
jgi:hypothetical protein